MSESTVAIVGSGIVGATVAYQLTRAGYDVVMFEKGPAFPYPHEPQYTEKILYLHDSNPKWVLPPDLKKVTLSGDYARIHVDIDGERGMVVGGSATHWGGVSLRMRPVDFKLRSKYGYAADWPLSYDELEPYYGRAEAHIGVSGTDDDNPFAPPRSAPFPLPPFELTWDDQVLAERLKKSGIHLHSTPQARARHAYDDRQGCMNMGVCYTCPIGARYSPNHHLEKALATGKLTLRPNTSIRRVLMDDAGRARALVVRAHDSAKEEEHAAKVIIVAGGAIESARLLLLSKDAKRPNGIGNDAGLVGQNLVFHHYYTCSLRYREKLYAGRAGPQTAQSQQFVDPDTRGKHGGLKIDFHSWPAAPNPWERFSGADVLRDMEDMKHTHPLGLHAESIPGKGKWVGLSEETDRFGDPFAHLHYDSNDFDYATHQWSKTIYERFLKGSDAVEGSFPEDPNEFSSGSHHMGTCRMGADQKDSVLDAQGRVHGSPNLFVLGGASFPTATGAVHPTLTMAALALRAADFVLTDLLK